MIKLINTKKDLQTQIKVLKTNGLTIGLVPTMGALHLGHLSLITLAKEKSERVICSIFVNPTQFNNKEDLQKYPRTLETDVDLLENAGVDFVFAPTIDEMYETNETWFFELGELDTIMEGKFRKGHFQGVSQIVYKLFDLIKPDLAVFGQKDFQQYAVIQKLVVDFKLPIHLICAPTIRDEKGLALSSRNARLNSTDKNHAYSLSKALNYFKSQKEISEFNVSLKQAIKIIEDTPDIMLEYFEVRDVVSLKIATKWNSFSSLVVCVAAQVGSVRLLDNIVID